MKIKALKTFTAFTGQMNVFNTGDTGELPNDVALQFIESGHAQCIDGSLAQLDHDGDGAPGGSEPHQPPSLTGKNKAELLAIAEAEGVEANAEMTNKAIAEAIEAAREAGDEGEAPAA